ncbi:hypothetical protein CJP74_02620 [Psittacicella melopsittaci]|uniref:Uncharacterized protein n=1 Tax=Psittacicella melopsittaci TaxID=2028576 RepID=A0A3A1Y7H0_9GAMM|nr:hypothetical protein [Psittacicella melopsittaci]RIY33168.1 hypothetical protein CJP74_02620 [Psittacicella melopsittaci]
MSNNELFQAMVNELFNNAEFSDAQSSSTLTHQEAAFVVDEYAFSNNFATLSNDEVNAFAYSLLGLDSNSF